MKRAAIGAVVVNGTHPDDWLAVADLARQPGLPFRVFPAWGVHPWKAARRPPDWEVQMSQYLDADASASIGEIGLDLWMEDPDLEDQLLVFSRQMEMATERNVPATIHCVRAWEPLRHALRQSAIPACGFLIHAWNGPESMIPFLEDLGARFSFSPSFLRPEKGKTRDSFRRMSRNRILIETDAPDLPPPASEAGDPALLLTDPVSGRRLHHPAGLPVALHGLAAVLGIPAEEAAELTTMNWHQLFDPARTAGSGQAAAPAAARKDGSARVREAGP